MAAEVGEAELVDLDHAFLADGAFPPGHRSGEHPVDVGVGLLGRPGHVAEHRGNRQVWFEVVVAIRWVSEAGFGGRRDIWIWVGRGSCCTFSGEWRAGVPQGHLTESWGAVDTVRPQASSATEMRHSIAWHWSTSAAAGLLLLGRMRSSSRQPRCSP